MSYPTPRNQEHSDQLAVESQEANTKVNSEAKSKATLKKGSE